MATIEGGSRNDTLVGTLGGDTIRGRGGNDTIYADPTVFDFIGGNDTVDGGDGDDLIYAFGGRDNVRGGTGRDRIFTADGDDVIDAGTGDDSDVQSGRGNDLVHGGDGADDLKGGEGADRLYGEAGADRVAGGSDNDLVVGGEGADTLGGRTGADRLKLQEATRVTDTIVFQAEDVGAGVDTIVGFDPGAPNTGLKGKSVTLTLNYLNAEDSAPLTLIGHLAGDPALIVDAPSCRVTIVNANRFGHGCASGGGSAGGPIFARDGRVIGIEFAGSSGGSREDTNIAIRADRILSASAALRGVAPVSTNTGAPRR